MKVREIMTQPVLAAQENTTLENIAKVMLDSGIGAMLVIDENGKLSGIITESDFMAKDRGIPFSTLRAPQLFGQWLSGEGVERIYEAARRTTASQIMSRRVLTIDEDDSIEKLLELMLEHDLKRVPVVKDGAPVGIVARHDILKMMLRGKPARKSGDAAPENVATDASVASA